jgi:hypothetical protein
MYFELRIEPKKDMTKEEVRLRIEAAFKDVGLYEEGVEFLNID